LSIEERIEKDRRNLDKRVRKRTRRLGLTERDYVVALEAEARGDPMPSKPLVMRTLRRM